MKLRTLAIAVLSALLSTCIAVSQQRSSSARPRRGILRYTITDLGAKGFSFGRDVNNRGEAVGISWDQNSVGMLYSKGHVITLLPTKDQPASDVVAINDSGWVAGNSNVRVLAGVKRTRATVWIGGKPQDLGMLRGDNTSDAAAVNNKGLVVGNSGYFDLNDPAKTRSKAVMWVGGKIKELPIPSGPSTVATGVNDLGDIVGFRSTSERAGRCFIYHAGRVRDLQNPAGGRAYIGPINNKGQSVGEGDVKPDVSHALMWSDGRVIDLGVLPGHKDSTASDINNLGDVVGYSGIGLKSERAFIWRNGKTFDLNRLVPKGSGWVLRIASAINDRGQIIGHGTHRGKEGAFLLTPYH